MNELYGLLFAPLAVISPNTALPGFLVWLGLKELSTIKDQLFSLPQDLLKTLALFIAWIILSSFWSLSPYGSLIAAVKVGGFILLGLSWVSLCLRQTKAQAFLFLKGLALGCGGIAIFILADYALDNKFSYWRDISNIKAYYAASHVLALCFYPLCFWVYTHIHPLLCFLLAFLIVAALSTLDIDIALAALACGGGVQVLAYLFPRNLFKGLWQVGFAFLMVASPFFCAFILSPQLIQAFNQAIPIFSYVHRLHIWHFLSKQVFLHPWIGQGLDASRLEIIRPTSYTWTFFEKMTHKPVVVHHFLPQEPLFWHVHNAVIQLWFELGCVGVFIASLFLLKVFARIHSKPQPQRLLALGYTATAMTIALASVDFWHSWWFATLWISSGVVILVNQALLQK